MLKLPTAVVKRFDELTAGGSSVCRRARSSSPAGRALALAVRAKFEAIRAPPDKGE